MTSGKTMHLRRLLSQSKRQMIFTLIGLVAAVTLLTAFKMAIRDPPRSMLQKTDQADTDKSPQQTLIPMDISFLSIIESAMSNMTDGQLEQLYFSILRHRQIDCLNSRRIGKTTDGGWDICFAGPFDISRTGRPPCVAFSFGVNGEYEYDDVLADTYSCRVHMFDPSMKGVENHQRRNTSWFYKIGLASKNYDLDSGWTMRTLCSLLKQFGYENSPIDILKVDVEIWEWESFEAALSDGCLTRVKQLLFESHTYEMLNKRSNFKHLIRVWLSLFNAGFRTWKWHENPNSIFFNWHGVRRACCYEHYMLNVAYI